MTEGELILGRSGIPVSEVKRSLISHLVILVKWRDPKFFLLALAILRNVAYNVYFCLHEMIRKNAAMATRAQILANRANAKRSTGPATPAVSRIAVRHGILRLLCEI